MASHINSDERSGRAELIFLDTDPRNSAFWEALGGYRDPASLPEGPADESVEVRTTRKLFKISNASGAMEFVDVTAAALTKSLLDDADVFLLHASTGKLFVWIGRTSNAAEKREATACAVKYLQAHHLPANTQIERVSSGTETSSFKAEFTTWDAPVRFDSSPQKASSAAEEVDVKSLLHRQRASEQMLDDGSGRLQVWVVKDFKKEELSKASYGDFFGGDSYLLLYSYRKGAAEEQMIYFWLGNDSSLDERGAAALLAVELDDSLGGKPVQVNTFCCCALLLDCCAGCWLRLCLCARNPSADRCLTGESGPRQGTRSLPRTLQGRHGRVFRRTQSRRRTERPSGCGSVPHPRIQSHQHHGCASDSSCGKCSFSCLLLC